MVDEQRVLMYALFPGVAYLEAAFIVGYASMVVLSVMTHNYAEVPNQLIQQPIEIEGEDRAA